MEKTKTAAFQLQRYIIPEFSFEEAEDKYSIIDIKLHPAGTYNTSNGEYQVVVVFIANAISEKNTDDQKTVLKGALKAFFKFEEKLADNEIPDFFYQNSLAIVFPYLRSFISNITLQAGTRLLILPLLNLTSLSTTLKENTKIFK